MDLSNIMQRCEATETKVQSLNRTDCLSPVLEYPDEICKTWRQGIDINPGLKLVTENFRPHKNISIGFEIRHPLVIFGFVISGNSDFTVSQGQSQKGFIHSKSGLSTVCFIPKSHGLVEFSDMKPESSVGIHIDPLFYWILLWKAILTGFHTIFELFLMALKRSITSSTRR